MAKSYLFVKWTISRLFYIIVPNLVKTVTTAKWKPGFKVHDPDLPQSNKTVYVKCQQAL